MLTIPLGQEGSINRLICKAKKSKNLLCLSLSYEPVIEQEFDWIETRGAYTSKVSLAQQFLETKAKVLFRSLLDKSSLPIIVGYSNANANYRLGLGLGE